MSDEYALLQQAPDPNAQENCTLSGVPNEAYHAARGVSKSDLAEILDWTPAHWKARKEEPREETDAMRFGTALHAAVLEPDRFAAEYEIAPDVDRRTKAGKETWEAAQAGGKILLKADQMQAVGRMRDNILDLHAVQVLLSSGEAEVSMFAHLADFHPLRGKCRPDWLNTEQSAILDLKTTTDARPQKFNNAVFEFHYEMQVAYYSHIYNLRTGDTLRAFVFVAVEKTPPYAAAAYVLDAPAIEYGGVECRRALDIFQRCFANDDWPGYSRQVETIGLPKWATAASF